MSDKGLGPRILVKLRNLRASSCAVPGGYGRCRWAQAAVLGWLALGVWLSPGPRSAPPSSRDAAVSVAQPDVPASDELAGVWRLEAPGRDGDPVHFYYFHGDGTGLYRYGVIGLTNTHSFDYRIEGPGRLHLTFRKSGRRHDLRYRVESDRDGLHLTLTPDPRGRPGLRYRKEAGGARGAESPWGAPLDDTPRRKGHAGPGPAGHMWIDLQRHATGGQSFGFYQFAPARIDGRGVGWFHRGDFDEWSTEALTYRVREGVLDLHFTVRDEAASTPYRIDAVEGGRVLTLDTDPRDFGAPHRYPDAGPSFGARGTPLPVPAP